MLVSDLIALLSNMPADARVVHLDHDDMGYPYYSDASVALDANGDVYVSGSAD